MSLTCIDCFSGAGGLSLGLSRAGFDVLLSFDNDATSVETQRRNPTYFPHEVLHSGIEELLGGKLLAKAGLKPGELDLLAGGPPCQGFSIQRIGLDSDERNDLVLRYVSLIEEVRPKFFLMENVRGLAGARGRQYLDKVLSTAVEIGYHVQIAVLNAQDYGVPQRRERVFIVGEHQGRDLSPRFSFPEPTTPKGRCVTVRDAIGMLPAPPEDGSDHPEYSHHRRDKLTGINLQRLAVLKEGQGMEHLPVDLRAACHRDGPQKIGHRNVYGRMKWDDVAPTITARFDSFTRGLFGHPSQLRSISLREGALIQTFPSDMNFAGTKVEIARQIGNAVPVLLAQAVGSSIAHALNPIPERVS